MQDAPNSKPKPSPLSWALAEHSGVPELLTDTELLPEPELPDDADDVVLPYWQLALFSQPHPSPLLTAALVQAGALEPDEPELLLDADDVVPRYWQLALFSQPHPSPLLIAALVQVGALEPDEAELEDEVAAVPLQDRPFSKPQPSLPKTAVEEQVGCPVGMTQERLFS